PLTTLIGYSNTLTTLGDNRQIREEAGAAIARGAKRVNRLLDGLMALASSGADTTIINCNPVEVTELVVDAITDISCASQLTIELNIDDQLRNRPHHVEMAATNFERMLFNVVENSVNSAPANSTITITLSKDGDMLEIEVADHGCGVAKQHIPHLTERFYRVDSSRSQGGHGLGLAIVAEQIELCHGTIEIRNNLPTGLLVTMRIPFSLPDDN
ncbi:MAG: ATP-binding protein, partial [Mariprofundales bacterium]|nr:ATP-binding protein [Mariprofundales bacterium]